MHTAGRLAGNRQRLKVDPVPAAGIGNQPGGLADAVGIGSKAVRIDHTLQHLEGLLPDLGHGIFDLADLHQSPFFLISETAASKDSR